MTENELRAQRVLSTPLEPELRGSTQAPSTLSREAILSWRQCIEAVRTYFLYNFEQILTI